LQSCAGRPTSGKSCGLTLFQNSWFAKRFDTRGLKDAKALLAELSE
jgi:hypothetical protein